MCSVGGVPLQYKVMTMLRRGRERGEEKGGGKGTSQGEGRHITGGREGTSQGGEAHHGGGTSQGRGGEAHLMSIHCTKCAF